ncbi:MAG: YcaO-like family protein, partial [Candidatus Eremiobacterota bacterium]
MIKHYKELNPEETIKKLKDILEENRIIASKQTAGNALNSLYFCRIGIKDTPVGVNGKGITEELSLASGLAELLERLQNQVLISPYELSPEAMKKFGFIYDVYEKLLPSSQYLPLPGDFKKGHLYVYNCSTGDLWDKYREYMADKNKEFPFIPYYNVNEDKLEYLPYRFFWYIYSTNGMCGGNSPQEAITQGICEIFERHVQAEIYFRELTPPTIPHEYFKEHAPYQYNLIKMLEDTGFYKIIVKDCSLGLGFPVIGTVVIFKDKNKYAFKFGSDPDMAIALERCLTEFFQGRRIFYDDLLAPVNTVPVFDKEEYER